MRSQPGYDRLRTMRISFAGSLASRAVRPCWISGRRRSGDAEKLGELLRRELPFRCRSQAAWCRSHCLPASGAQVRRARASRERRGSGPGPTAVLEKLELRQERLIQSLEREDDPDGLIFSRVRVRLGELEEERRGTNDELRNLERKRTRRSRVRPSFLMRSP